MDYEPKWANQPIKTKLLEIEQGVVNIFDSNKKPVMLRTRQDIKPIFGAHTNPLYKFLMHHLMWVTSDSKSIQGAEAYQYNFNWNNLLCFFVKSGLVTFEHVQTMTGIKELKLEKRPAKKTIFLSSVNNNKAFDFFMYRFFSVYNQHMLHENVEYQQCKTTTRLLNDFQNKPKKIKAMFFKQHWDVDAKACAYTVCHQKAVEVCGDIFKVIPMIYKDRDRVRAQLSADLGVDIPMVKEMLASILFDGKLVNNPKSGIFQEVEYQGYDVYEFFERASKSALLSELIVELQIMWPALRQDWDLKNPDFDNSIFYSVKRDKKTKEVKSIKFRPAAKNARIYFELERQVIDVVRELYKDKVCHLMHDGVIVQDEPDVELLSREVLKRTCLHVEFSVNQF